MVAGRHHSGPVDADEAAGGGDRRSPLVPGRAAPPPRRWRPATRAVVTGRPPRSPDAPLNPPVVLASTYHAGGPVAYGRDGNETWTALEEAIGDLEGGSCVTFASGMAAVSAVLDLVPVGGVVVAPVDGYYGLRAALEAAPAGRFTLRWYATADTDAAVAACDGAALVWVESPANPGMDVADISAVAAAAERHGAVLAVDNTFPTPLGQQPLRLGAHLSVHSVSKLIAGHSDVLLGAVACRPDGPWCEDLRRRRAYAGAVPGPVEAYLALRGLRTLPLRVERAQGSAGELARRLSAHPGVRLVRYPGLPSDPGYQRACVQMDGFGTMVAFEVDGGASAAEAAAGATELIVHATSLGGVETQMERRARWPGERAAPGLLRLSVGCEDVEDLWDDLSHALAVADRVTAAGRPAATPTVSPVRRHLAGPGSGSTPGFPGPPAGPAS